MVIYNQRGSNEEMLKATGCIARRLPQSKTFSGRKPRPNTSEIFELDINDYHRMSPLMVATAYMDVEHNDKRHGRITKSYLNETGDWMIDYELDESKLKPVMSRLLRSGAMGDLSLKHDSDSMTPINVSVCFRGARENSNTTRIDKFPEYKASPNIVSASASSMSHFSAVRTQSPETSYNPQFDNNLPSFQSLTQPVVQQIQQQRQQQQAQQQAQRLPTPQEYAEQYAKQFAPPSHNGQQFAPPGAPAPVEAPLQSGAPPQIPPPAQDDPMDPLERFQKRLGSSNVNVEEKGVITESVLQIAAEAEASKKKIDELNQTVAKLQANASEGDSASADAFTALLKLSNLPGLQEKLNSFSAMNANERTIPALARQVGHGTIVAASYALYAQLTQPVSKQDDKMSELIASRKRAYTGAAPVQIPAASALPNAYQNRPGVVAASYQMPQNWMGRVPGMQQGTMDLFNQFESDASSGSQTVALKDLRHNTAHSPWVSQVGRAGR